MHMQADLPDRDARIAARRERIKERLGAQKGEGEGTCLSVIAERIILPVI